MVQLTEELLLVHDRVDTALGDDTRLRHLLHRVQLLLLAELNFPDLAEATAPNHVQKVVVILVDLCATKSPKFSSHRLSLDQVISRKIFKIWLREPLCSRK